jgi:hypothetical protein
MINKDDANRWMWSAVLALLLISLIRKIFK